MRHNAELIKQWADGKEIQYQDHNGAWIDTDSPWATGLKYRLKPTEDSSDLAKYNVIVGDFWITNSDELIAIVSVINHSNTFITVTGVYGEFTELKTLVFRQNTLNKMSGVINENP